MTVELAPSFSHIYLEQGARDFAPCRDILARFSRAQIIPVKHYKEIFNRVRQDQLAQKNSQKLILARQTGKFLYPATAGMHRFGHEHFFYNLLGINCVYDCSYCFLQGMYSSANLVLFVNLEDYFAATREILKQLGRIHLSLSYQTDLLAIEGIYPYCRKWIEFARKQQGLSIEIRTKSANFSAISDLEPSANTILAWTLSPAEIAKQHEKGAADVGKRLRAARAAQDLGWKVRICIDPVLMVENWSDRYAVLIEDVFDKLDASKLHDVSIGTLRLSKSHYKKISKLGSSREELMSNLHINTGYAGYPEETHKSLIQLVLSNLERHLAPNQIHLL